APPPPADTPRPRRWRLAADALEQATLGERPVHQDGDAALGGQRQDATLRLALADRVVHLEEIELLAPQHALQLVVRARRVVGDAQVADAARLLEIPEGRELGAAVEDAAVPQQLPDAC